MDLDQLVDLPPDGHQRVERGHRLLEHHRDLVAPELAQALAGDAEQVLAVEPDFPSLRAYVRSGQQAHDRPAGEGLARSGLADQAHDLVASDVEADPFHRKRDGRRARAGARGDREWRAGAIRPWRSGGQVFRSRGLRASFSPSPTRLIASHREQDCDAGKRADPPGGAQDGSPRADQVAPAHHVGIPETEEREPGLDEDRGGHHQRTDDDDRREAVRQDVQHRDAKVAHPDAGARPGRTPGCEVP